MLSNLLIPRTKEKFDVEHFIYGNSCIHRELEILIQLDCSISYQHYSSFFFDYLVAR